MSFYARYSWQTLEAHRVAKSVESGAGAFPGKFPLQRQSSLEVQSENSDKVLLPPSALESLARTFDTLPSPLTFQISTLSGAKTFVGVLEFSSPEDTITLPSAVVDSLALKGGSSSGGGGDAQLNVRYVALPKARKVSLKPLTSDFASDIPDHRSFLERALPQQYTILFPGQLLTLRHLGADYQLLVTELEPSSAPAVVIVNADVDLVLLPSFAATSLSASNSTAGGEAGGATEGKDAGATAAGAGIAGAGGNSRRGVTYLRPGVPVTGVAEVGGYSYYSFAYPTGVHPADLVPKVTIESTPTTGSSGDVDADAFISVHPMRKPTLLQHHWALNCVGGGSLLLLPETESLIMPGEPRRTVRPGTGPQYEGLKQAIEEAASKAADTSSKSAMDGVDSAASTAPAVGAGTAGPSSPASPASSSSMNALLAKIAAEKQKEREAEAMAAAAAAKAAGAAGLDEAASTAGASSVSMPSIPAPPSYYVGVTAFSAAAASSSSSPHPQTCNFTLKVEFVPADEAIAAVGGGSGAGAGAGTMPMQLQLPPTAPNNGGLVGMKVPSVLDEEKAAIAASIASAAAAAAAVSASGADSSGSASGKKQCPHCSQWISALNPTTYTLHTAQCARLNTRCPHPGCGAVLRKTATTFDDHQHCEVCSRVMPKAVLSKHKALFHTPHPCECGLGSLTIPELRLHVRDSCPRRVIICRFCGDSVRAGEPCADHRDRLNGLSEHESVCGSRTAPCGVCSRVLPMKEHPLHWRIAHTDRDFDKDGSYGYAQLSTNTNNNTNGSGSSGMDVDGEDGSGSSSSSEVALEWPCVACSFVNAPYNRVCEICSTAKPGAVGGSSGASSRSGSISSVGASGEWACPACTCINDYGLTCSACGGPKPKPAAASSSSFASRAFGAVDSSGSDGSRTMATRAGAAALSRLASSSGGGAVSRPCRNQCCSNYAARVPAASSSSSSSAETERAAALFGVCVRCYEMMSDLLGFGGGGDGGGDDEEEELVDGLIRVYGSQLGVGCGDSGFCSNPYCRTGRERRMMSSSSAASGGPTTTWGIGSSAPRPMLRRETSITDDLPRLIEAARGDKGGAATAPVPAPAPVVVAPPAAAAPSSIACPVCTFSNGPYASRCEMCSSALPKPAGAATSAAIPAAQLPPTHPSLARSTTTSGGSSSAGASMRKAPRYWLCVPSKQRAPIPLLEGDADTAATAPSSAATASAPPADAPGLPKPAAAASAVSSVAVSSSIPLASASTAAAAARRRAEASRVAGAFF